MFEEWQLDTQRLGRRVLVHDSVASTNSLACELAQDPGNDGVVVLAREQTAGRGTQGRSWQCPPGAGVLLSVLLFPPLVLRQPALLTAWAAVSVCETVRAVTGLQARIKWPNDVLIRSRKVCGILIETKVSASLAAAGSPPALYCVAGIGLNVNQQADAFTLPGLEQAISLGQCTSKHHDADGVARTLIGRLDEEYDRLCQGDLATLEACWKWHVGLLGKQVEVECADAVHQGRLCEMTFQHLELELRAGEVLKLKPEAVRQVRAK